MVRRARFGNDDGPSLRLGMIWVSFVVTFGCLASSSDEEGESNRARRRKEGTGKSGWWRGRSVCVEGVGAASEYRVATGDDLPTLGSLRWDGMSGKGKTGEGRGTEQTTCWGGGRDADAGPSSVGGLDLSVSVSFLFCSVERRCGEMES